MPEGAEVTVRIELTPIEEKTTSAEGDFASLPFFGMWSEREDMEDSTAWVDKERRSWHQRRTRQD